MPTNPFEGTVSFETAASGRLLPRVHVSPWYWAPRPERLPDPPAEPERERFRRLSPRNRWIVLRHLVGTWRRKRPTLKKMAARYRVSPERIRQIVLYATCRFGASHRAFWRMMERPETARRMIRALVASGIL